MNPQKYHNGQQIYDLDTVDTILSEKIKMASQELARDLKAVRHNHSTYESIS